MHQCPHNPGTTHSQALMTDRIISHIQISDWGDSLSDDACPMAWNCSMKSEQITPKAPAFMQRKTPQDHCEVGADSSAVIELKPPGGDWRCAMPKSLPFAKPIALLSIPSSLPTWVCSLVRKKGAQMGHFSPMEGQACPQGWDWPQPRVAGSVVGHSCWLLLAWLSAKQRCCFLLQTLIFSTCWFYCIMHPFSQLDLWLTAHLKGHRGALLLSSRSLNCPSPHLPVSADKKWVMRWDIEK